jgi:mono/diheme cytochrome c family protein
MWLGLSLNAQAAAPSSDGLRFFENKVRPLLVQNCQDCHGASKHKGGLRLDNLPYMLQGGEQGPALVPHQPDKSLLMKAIGYADKDMQMPPDGKMSAADIATLRQWIAMGAPWPEAEVASAKLARKPGQITDEDRQWWSFQPLPKAVKVPAVAGANQRNPMPSCSKAWRRTT